MSRSVVKAHAYRARALLCVLALLTACADVPFDAAGDALRPGAPSSASLAPPAELAPHAHDPAAEAEAREVEVAQTVEALEAQACESADNQCFGAVGSRCGGTPESWPVELPELVQVGCRGDRCWTNAGSWEHDECCDRHPRGHWCADLASIASTACKPAWDRAVHRVTHGLGWLREVDRCRVDDDGEVNFEEYCAPRGTIVASDDARVCCSQHTRKLNIFRDFARMARQGVLVDDSYRPVVCW